MSPVDHNPPHTLHVVARLLQSTKGGPIIQCVLSNPDSVSMHIQIAILAWPWIINSTSLTQFVNHRCLAPLYQAFPRFSRRYYARIIAAIGSGPKSPSNNRHGVSRGVTVGKLDVHKMPTIWEIRKGKALVTVTARLLRLTIKEQRKLSTLHLG